MEESCTVAPAALGPATRPWDEGRYLFIDIAIPARYLCSAVGRGTGSTFSRARAVKYHGYLAMVPREVWRIFQDVLHVFYTEAKHVATPRMRRSQRSALEVLVDRDSGAGPRWVSFWNPVSELVQHLAPPALRDEADWAMALPSLRMPEHLRFPRRKQKTQNLRMS